MADVPWWQTAVIYQIYPRSFSDTTGNGVGDLPGITRRLGYLARDLGVDAIWISPFYRSPMADFGYDVSDYCDVDPLFGTLADFDEVVTRAHDLDLKVIIDWVPNHTSDRHPWFRESRSSRDHPRRDWYVWVDPDPEGRPPNNWLSVFGGPAWEYDAATGQFYLHSFLAEQPDLNWRNPEVVAAMHDTLRFWLDRGVDGFRLDVAHYIMKDPALRSNPPAARPPVGQDIGGAYGEQEHLYDKGHPDVHGAFRAIRAVVDEYDGDRFTVGEIHVFDWERWAAYYGTGDELHMPYNFSLLYAPWEAHAFRTLIETMEQVLPPGAWPNVVLGNHDEVRLATRYGPRRARVAAMALLTLRGTATMYYGDEIGMTEVPIPPHRQRDPWIRNGTTRDGCRTPMQWDGSPNAGFTEAGFTPWLPIEPGHDTANVASQLADPDSLLNLYRALLALRRRSPALHRGDYRSVPGPPEVFVFARTYEDLEMLVALNFSSEPQTIDLPPQARLVLATSSSAAVMDGERLALEGDAGAVVVVS